MSISESHFYIRFIENRRKKIESAWLLQMLDLYSNIRVQPLGPYTVLSHCQVPKNTENGLDAKSAEVLTF